MDARYCAFGASGDTVYALAARDGMCSGEQGSAAGTGAREIC